MFTNQTIKLEKNKKALGAHISYPSSVAAVVFGGQYRDSCNRPCLSIRGNEGSRMVQS